MKKLDLLQFTSNSAQDYYIARRVLNGEKELFFLLVRPHQKTLFNVLSIYTSDRLHCQHMMFDAYTYAYKNLYLFHRQTSFISWLLATAIRQVRLSKHGASDGTSHEHIGNRGDRHADEKLVLLMREHLLLSEREIAFCLGLTVQRVNELAQESVTFTVNVFDFESNNVDPAAWLQPLESFMRTVNSEDDPMNVKFPSSSRSLEATKHPTEIDISDLKREHQANMMLCSNIRNGFLKGVQLDRIKRYADWYWENHLSKHFKEEERMIFPILGSDNQLVKKALADHRRLARLFRSREDIHKVLNRIEEELESHVRFEEKVLFKAIETSGDAHAMERVETIHQTIVEPSWNDCFWE